MMLLKMYIKLFSNQYMLFLMNRLMNRLMQKFQIVCYMLSALYLNYYRKHTIIKEVIFEHKDEAKQLFEYIFLVLPFFDNLLNVFDEVNFKRE